MNSESPTFELRKDIFADERDDNLNEIGQPTIRQDILGHVTGRSPFFDDHLFDGLLHLKCVRSPHHKARIRRVDTSLAERMPGVVKVLSEKDVPVNKNTLLSLINFGKDDEPLLASGQVNFRGEPIIAIIAETEGQALDAVAAVQVEYEVLPHVLDPEEALAPDAPIVNETYPDNAFDYHDRYDHQKIRFGDVETAFTKADKIVEARYQMSPIEHAPTETNGSIAAPETNNRIVVYTSTQALFFSLGTTAKLMDVSSARLHFIGGTVGGGFGGKVDTVVEPLAVLACMLTGKAVRFVYSREEEMQVSSPRGAERWYIKDGIMNDGRIIARQFRGYFDGGAYTRLSSYAVIKGAAHLPGPYTIENVNANVYCVYTNRVPASAMRGFGITGVDFAIECHMDRGAEAVGMDPVEFRLLNSYRDGDMKAHRREAKNTALIECMQVAAEKSGWKIGDQFKQMASNKDGGGERAVIPATVTDQEGTIGSRRSQANGAGISQTIRPTTTAQSTQVPSQPIFPPPPAPLPTAIPTYQTPQQSPSAAASQAASASSSETAASSAANSGSPSSPPANETPSTARSAATRPRSKARFSSLIGTRRR